MLFVHDPSLMFSPLLGWGGVAARVIMWGAKPRLTRMRNIDMGWMSSNTTLNPMMSSWNAAYLRYCDQASFSSSAGTVDDGEGGELHLEGRALLHGYMAWLNGRGLDKASQVVVSGGSAGGHAVFQTLSPFQGNSPRAFTVGMPVSGFFATVCTSVAPCAVRCL